jgi:hypothetical protein
VNLSIQYAEVLFVLISLFGLTFALFNWKNARDTCNFLVQKGIYNGRQKLAKFTKKAEGIRVVTQLVFLTAGLSSFFLPPDSVDTLPPDLQPIAVILRASLISAAALTATQSFIGWRFRKNYVEPHLLIPDEDVLD